MLTTQYGTELTEEDYRRLAERWITPHGAVSAGLRRIDSLTGREMFSRKSGDLAGIIIPNAWAGDDHIRDYRLRRDNPDMQRHSDGSVTELNKYVQPPGRGNLLYLPSDMDPGLLERPDIPIIITEGELKTLALWRLANDGVTTPRFIPVGVTGVWNWRGTVGKTNGPNGQRRDLKGVIPDVDRIPWKGHQVIIAFDADSQENANVRVARSALAGALMERKATVGYLEWPMAEGKGIDDRLANVGPGRVLADIAATKFNDWQTRLLYTQKGYLRACYENVALFLENAPEWEGVLGYNEFTGGHVALRQPPAPISARPGKEIEDHFDTEAVRWLERRGVMVKPDLVRRVLDSAARQNSFHPVRQYLESLQWDGTPRIGSWLVDYCKVDSSAYALAVGEKFLISAVARVMQPGCKADHMLVLEGPQGIGKSTIVRSLAGDWFTDQIADPGSKDCSMQLRGAWLIELSELGALSRTDMERTKAFVTQQVERFRLPYGHRVVDMPRQCAFIGTTNSETWLKDETGGRRFWPVRCGGPIDIAGLIRDRDQLWAEAFLLYHQGVTWWLEDEEVVKQAVEQQRDRYQDDVWQHLIETFAAEQAERPTGTRPEGHVSIWEILDRLGVETARQDQAAANRVARCLKTAGWERHRVRIGDESPRLYRKVEPQ